MGGKSVRCKMSSRTYFTTWGIKSVFSNNYKWKANLHNCIIRKKRKERGGELGGKKGRKIMAFFAGHKEKLIRHLLAK